MATLHFQCTRTDWYRSSRQFELGRTEAEEFLTYFKPDSIKAATLYRADGVTVVPYWHVFIHQRAVSMRRRTIWRHMFDSCSVAER